MGETLTREQIDDIERDTLREHQEDSTTIEALCAMARALLDERAENKANRARIAQAVGAVHEWDYGSSPGTWEQIEDKAKSDYQQAAYDLDARIVAEYGLAIMSRRARRWEAAARRLHESRESTRQWYAVRWVRLKELLRGTTYWQEAMCTVANGTANVHEPPTYAQQLNMMRFAEERAIAQRDVARADLATARRELAEALESAGANAEALLLARRELGEVREAATVALAALRRYESAEGYKQDWRVDEAVAHLSAALGKEQGNG